ncbi:mitochondrial distribution and morphology protein 34 [Xylogone sp. PMI_703]|nr:mitochondrial distribution and morphology protein 34 [Xylogone sp. PMI_703]
MAFNFSWSPLTADAEFYSRAREMLTTALNKSPKPPIIVDDILVSELNLGSVPPDLEILEIGDLAQDRFRGIFKMCYSGDAFLTLQTRVQANPLNTYLFSKPTFASPQPLAAASGLTIPLQITLSDIKLSAFIILVFSQQKGLTLVFRNDPLESIKVSSTFDSIPFVRDYLQKEIELQLRNLMMDELPAIIHRLSLRLWCPDYRTKEDEEKAENSLLTPKDDEVAIDPFASPPQDAVDARGNVLDASQISSLNLDGSSELSTLFSQKNLLRLAALNDSHRTLSLFTPSIQEAVFRAWAGPTERNDSHGSSTPATPNLNRSQSWISSGVNNAYSDATSDSGLPSSRLSTISMHSATTGLSLGAGRHSRSHAMRKKKHRIVDLRKGRSKTTDDVSSEGADVDSASIGESSTTPASEPLLSTSIPEEPEDNVTPPVSPELKAHFDAETETPESLSPQRPSLEASPTIASKRPLAISRSSQPLLATERDSRSTQPFSSATAPLAFIPTRPRFTRSFSPVSYGSEKSPLRYRSSSTASASQQQEVASALAQAFMYKMANELARRANDEKAAAFVDASRSRPDAGNRNGGFWGSDLDETPPPAYEPLS